MVFDHTLASGVLYHMTNPVELIELISKSTSKSVFVWTHYYDKNLIDINHAILKHKFVSSDEFLHAGYKHTIYKQLYKKALGWQGFCGGSENYSYWLSRQDILDAFKYFGFSKIDIGFDDEKHPNGPAFAFVAYK